MIIVKVIDGPKHKSIKDVELKLLKLGIVRPLLCRLHWVDLRQQFDGIRLDKIPLKSNN